MIEARICSVLGSAGVRGVVGVRGNVGVFGKLVMKVTLSGVRAGVDEPEPEDEVEGERDEEE
jgi:hypothetical protein